MTQALPEYDHDSLWPNTKTLSSSQVLSYLKDPEEFYATYFLGNRRNTPAMQFGRIFSAAYADRNLDYAPHLRECGNGEKVIRWFAEALAKFPVIKGSLPEFPMIGTIGEWSIRATLDDFKYSMGLIIENKTGKVPWTQERVDSSPQLTIQWWAYFNKHAKHPKQFLLNWWNTKITSSVQIKSFKVKRTMEEIKECEELLVKVIEGIEAGNFSEPII